MDSALIQAKKLDRGDGEDYGLVGDITKVNPNAVSYTHLDVYKRQPVALNGKEMSAKEIVLALNEIGGRNGIGLVDLVENRLVGMKSRGVYETPGGAILYRAHQVLETITLDKDTAHYLSLIHI